MFTLVNISYHVCLRLSTKMPGKSRQKIKTGARHIRLRFRKTELSGLCAKKQNRSPAQTGPVLKGRTNGAERMPTGPEKHKIATQQSGCDFERRRKGANAVFARRRSLAAETELSGLCVKNAKPEPSQSGSGFERKNKWSGTNADGPRKTQNRNPAKRLRF